MDGYEILGYFQKRQPEIIRGIYEIVEIESPSFNSVQSSIVADWIESEARKASSELEITRITADDYGEHVVIRAFPGDEKSIMLLGHTDTVHPIGTNAANPTRIEGDKFHGCGIFDMKANIVLMLEALRYFVETGTKPPRPVTIFLSCDEEVGSFTGRPLIEKEAENVERCLVFEPSFNGAVKTGRKGTGMFQLHAHGIPSHAGLEPEKGASAILEISRQIGKIQLLNAPNKGTTVNVCTIKGGTTSNVIPEYAECEIDVRFSTMDEANRIEAELRDLKAVDERVSLSLSGAANRPPLERTADVVELYENARDLAASYDYEVGEMQVGGASDGNFVGALGIPVLDGLGIAGDGAHTLHEYILVSDIVKRATLVALLLGSP